MKTKIALAAVAALVLGFGSHAVFAGPGHHGPHMKAGMHDHFDRLATALKLTDQQKAAAEKIHDQADQVGAPLESQMKTQHDEIDAMLESGKADPTVLGNKMIAVHAVHKKLEALHRDARTKFIALLTAEQRATLDKMHADNPPFAGH